MDDGGRTGGMAEEVELVELFCPRCGVGLRIGWDNGLVPRPDYVAVGDWVFHAECWDAFLAGLEEETASLMCRSFYLI